ncbi:MULTISPECIES: hypothetical protein [Bradyrhizobium]|uniref:Uncharacterized protein n=1 Tax=Bradyrhizobium vignae TaxID=1549949 RepID=A0A2U3QBY2_9BRAD|nr:hypothetical protein [Bradyrhizobium vignae]SPP98944.1 protein of unknown function [Bradyrhizobium vignae]
MPLTPEVLTANGEVVARLRSLDISFAPDEEPQAATSPKCAARGCA